MEILVNRLTQVDPQFWQGKTVFLTGHTGFKGSWLALWLISMGARVTGYALPPNTHPNLFETLALDKELSYSYLADIRNFDVLHKAILETQPEIVIHMAAQALVRYSYQNPVETYATNVMGTVNLLESLRNLSSVRATVVVTSDKCYENTGTLNGYSEHEPMGGYDPYSSSKGCAELVTSAYRQSFFSRAELSQSSNAIASARAGNVIGGGDWSCDRLIPDAIKAFETNQVLKIRHPQAIRPWQHVLEPLSGYLILAQALHHQGNQFAQAWNFGPRKEDARSVQEVIELLISKWPAPVAWKQDELDQPHEAHTLSLDISKAQKQLNWMPKWHLETALEKVIQWHSAYDAQQDMRSLSLNQIHSYIES